MHVHIIIMNKIALNSESLKIKSQGILIMRLKEIKENSVLAILYFTISKIIYNEMYGTVYIAR